MKFSTYVQLKYKYKYQVLQHCLTPPKNSVINAGMCVCVRMRSRERGRREKSVSGQDVRTGQRQAVSHDDWDSNFTGKVIAVCSGLHNASLHSAYENICNFFCMHRPAFLLCCLSSQSFVVAPTSTTKKTKLATQTKEQANWL